MMSSALGLVGLSVNCRNIVTVTDQSFEAGNGKFGRTHKNYFHYSTSSGASILTALSV